MSQTSDKKLWGRLLLVTAGIVATSAGHYLTPRELLLWHNIFQRLYYLPIVYAAISFGWPGGLAAAAVSAVCYIPHIVLTWAGWRHYSANQYAELVVFFLVGTVTGVLADRERRREMELRRTAEQLRRVYRELQDSFEQIKRADRLSAVGQLSAGLAHEIRNPLASIEGAAEILGQESSGEEMRQEFLGIIRKECRRVNRLLSELLDFARPRKPEWREVDVGRVLDNVIGLLSHSAEKNGIILRKDVPAKLPPLLCDQEQLTQVVLNLTINATQAMPDGGEILLSARARDSNLLIQVRDEGIGIKDEDLDRIFDPFYTTKDYGTGLGLSVAHQIVTQHGGAISVQRNPGKGMTFSVTFPQAPGGMPS